MSARDYSKISPSVWRSRRFINLSDSSKLLFLYVITNPHVNSVGCYPLPDGYACADLGWPLDEYLKARDEVIQSNMVDFDETTHEVLIDCWFKHNPPMNDKHAIGTNRLLADINSPHLREKATLALNKADEQRTEALAKKKAELISTQDRANAEKKLYQITGMDRLGATNFVNGRR